jgi:hypothetical protein
VIAALVSAVLLAVLVSGATAKPRQFVEVLHGQKTVARFRDAQCVVNHHNDLFSLIVFRNTEASWGLSVNIDHFSGFHRYKIGWGFNDRVSLVVVGPHNTYSNVVRPPFKVRHGGSVDFARHGGVVGVEYQPAFVEKGQGTDGSDAVDLTGVLNCHYKKHKH